MLRIRQLNRIVYVLLVVFILAHQATQLVSASDNFSYSTATPVNSNKPSVFKNLYCSFFWKKNNACIDFAINHLPLQEPDKEILLKSVTTQQGITGLRLTLLKGEQGDPGATGPTGARGEKGSPGEKGDSGVKGDKGAAGAKGDKGETGEKGAQGEAASYSSGTGIVINGSTISSSLEDMIEAAEIADNAITGEKIALGADAQGDLMYYDGTNWVGLTAGTSGQFLQTQGVGGNPLWAGVDTLGAGTVASSILRWNGSDWVEESSFLIDESGNVTSGTWQSSPIDISSYTNLTAGNALTLSGDTLNVNDGFLVNNADDTTTGSLTFKDGVFTPQSAATNTEGRVFYDSDDNKLKLYDGATWIDLADTGGAGDLLSTNNLSDLTNPLVARSNLGLAIDTDVQAYDAKLADIANLAVTDGNLIVGNGTDWIAESGNTARTSLGLGSGDSPQFTALTITNSVAAGNGVDQGFGPASCPTGMMPVPPTNGRAGFCVDKYEAKNVSGIATSQASGTPWVSITQYDARAECIKAGKHLITEAERLQIAQNLEQVGWNWNGGVVGTNQMSDGHSDNSPGNTLAASTDDDPCSGTGQTCSESVWNAQRRTYKLSNNEYIWDLGGNVWEWTDQVTSNDYPVANNWSAWADCSDSGDGICGNTELTNDRRYGGNTTSTRGFRRGGDWRNGSAAGAFALHLNNAPSTS